MEASPLKSIVSVHTFADGRAEIIVSGAGGTFTLEVLPEGPTISIKDPERGNLRLQACMSLPTNRQLRGFFVAKKGATPREDTLEWFPARKKRAKKRTTEKRTMKA